MASQTFSTRVSVEPLLPSEGAALAPRLQQALSRLASVDITCEAVVWEAAQSRLVVKLQIRNVSLGSGVTKDEYIAATHAPALSLVRRSIEQTVPEAAALRLRVVDNALVVAAPRVQRIPRRTTEGPPTISTYRVVLEVTRLGVPIEEAARTVAGQLAKRADVHSPHASALPEREAVLLAWEMEGFDEEETANAALFLLENIISQSVEGADDLRMQIVELDRVRPRH